MNTKALAYTSVLALAIVGVSAKIVYEIYYDLQNNSQLSTKTKEIPNLSTYLENKSSKKPIHDNASSQELGRIKNELALLHNEIASLKNQQNDSTINPVQDVLHEENTPEKIEEAMQNMQVSFEEQLQAETVDTEWASETIESVQKSFSNEELSGVDLVDVSCGSTLCKLNLEMAPDLPMEEGLQRLSVHRSWEGATFISVDANGQPTLYFARSGYELPQGDF